jgi:nitrile hydratase subunit beta
MDGIHDLGGVHGFGKVEAETDEPIFHADWERRMFALTSAILFATQSSDDHFRREIERMEPLHYLRSSYYEKWYASVVALLEQHDLASATELSGAPPRPLPHNFDFSVVPRAAAVEAAILAGASQARPEIDAAPPRFSKGERVVARQTMPYGHTRLPRYVRGHVGIVETIEGFYVFADANATNQEPTPHWLYRIRFASRDLWGSEAPENDQLRITLWEPYLIAVSDNR